MFRYLPWSENIKKRACRYLLQRYLGNFLEEKLSLDQLSVDLYNGTGTVSDVSLDCEAINELGESQNWPLEIVDGYMQRISVSIPWSTILKDDSVVEVYGLSVTVQPKLRTENASSMLESMWSSMSSSMQLAAECLQQEADPTEAAPVEGIEIFAQTIDSILSRVKVKFIDTKIRVEHVPKDSETGIAFEIHIKNLNYLDEAGSEPPTELIQSEKNKTYVVSTFTSKKLSFEGVTFYTDEYPSQARTFSRSLIMEKSTDSQTPTDQTKSKDDIEKLTPDDGEVFYETRNTLETSSSSASPDAAESDHASEKKEREGQDNLRSPDMQTEPILFGKLTGRQEMNLRIKNSEEAAGPKVDLQLTLGSLIMLLSPRQLHTLIELANGLISPHLEDTSNMPRRTGAMPECKPMNAMDFERVEAQLLSGLTGGNLPSILTRHGWSGAGGMEDSDMDSDKFHPMASAGSGVGMGDSCTSSISSMSVSMTSSASTTLNVSPAHRVKRNRKVPQIDGDPTAEVSHINVRVASCACILLHQDILVPLALGPDCVLPTSVHEMQATAVQFFERLGLFAINGYGSKDYDHAHRIFDDACSLSHLRLLSTSITIEGNEKTTSQGCLTTGHFTVARFHLREVLCNNDSSKDVSQAYDILNFLRQGNEEKDGDFAYTNPLGGLPDIKLTFKKTQKAMRVAGEKRLIYPTTDISIVLQPCEVDLDLTILDRISASTHPLPLCRPAHPARTSAPPSTGQLLDQTISVQLDHQCAYKVECERFLLRLRFPIIDFRANPNAFSTPRLERNVRPDSLRATFTQMALRKVSDARRAVKIQMHSNKIDLYYFENDNDSGIHVGCASSDEISDSHNILYGMESPEPTITITILPTPRGRGPFDASSDEEGPYEASSQAPGATLAASALLLDELGGGAPGPFSSKKMAHESDTPHRKDDHGDMEELIVPGSAEEMEDFTQHSISHAAIQIECSLPVLSLQLESKQLYEVIYNRINTDLLLWEPAGRNIQSDMMKSIYKTNVLVEDVFKEANIYPAFSMCKSGVEYDSDSASSSSEDDNNVYYSTYGQKMKQKASQFLHMMKKENSSDLHNFCLSLRIGKGVLTMYTPVRDSSNHVVPNQAGESVIVAARLALCQVSGVHGRPRTALTSLHSRVARLYHCGLLPVPLTRPPLRMYCNTFSPDLYETIYPSGPGVALKDGAKNKDMLSVAISVNPNKDLNNFKNIRVAVGITGATLRHRWAAAGRSWLGQLLDTLDVLDYPVPGYQPSTVLTELHVHLWDSAVDYRPLYLPTKSVITLGSFSISSNVIANTNTSNLRFIAQECSLFLSEMTSKSKPTCDKPFSSKDDNVPVDLQKNYVCVMDLGLFELSLRLTEKSVKSTPHVDLRASNNAVHIWTCADSASSLFRLLTYVACDGDGSAPGDESNIANSSCSVDTMGLSRDEMLIGVDDKSQEDIRELSPSEAQQVNDLMEEAMKESPNSSIADQDEAQRSIIKEGVAVYYFPDESNSPKHKIEEDKPAATDSTETIKETVNPVQDDDELYPSQPDDELEEGPQQEVEEKVELLPAVIHVTRDLGDVQSPPKVEKKNLKTADRQQKLSEGSGNTDDEFCIIEERPTQTDPDLAEPVVRWLVKEPLNVIDNHFTIPTGKTDVLKAPKYFPMAVLRYTLCEMTVIWHMYGGNDFKSVANNKEEGVKKTVTINENQCRYSPTLTKRPSEQDPYNVIPRSPPSLPHRSTPHWQSAAVSYRVGSESVRTGSKKISTRGGIGRTCGAAWKYRGGSGRVRNTHVEFELNKVRFQHETYAEGEKFASRQTLAVAKVEVRDRLRGSSINKFLSDYTEEGEPERKNSNMVVIKAVHVRPDPQLPAQECCLKVSVQPLRFRIDQDTMQFLVDFFTKLGDGETLPGEDSHSALSGSNQSLSSAGGTPKHNTPTRQLPVMTVGSGVRADRNRRRASGSTASDTMTGSECGEEDAVSLGEDAQVEPLMENYEAERLVSENLIQLEEDFRQVTVGVGLAVGREQGVEQRTRSVSASSETVDDSPIYFRRVVFSPEVPIRLDYLGKRVDLKHGPLAGLIMGLGQLDCSQLKLKTLNHKHGILGFDRLLRWALHEWLTDIRRSQLPGILGGIGPMHSLLQFVRGVCDLVWLPIAQWRRDGRLVLGLRRGAASFTARTAVAALDITARLIHLIQATAETALDMVSPGPTLRPICARQRRRRARRRDPARQPHDIREGIANAYQLVKEGFSDTAQTMVVVAQAEHEARGYSGAVGGVLRQLPGVAVTPLALAAAATADILGGVRAQLVPGARRDDDDKWRATLDQDDETDGANNASLETYQP